MWSQIGLSIAPQDSNSSTKPRRGLNDWAAGFMHSGKAHHTDVYNVWVTGKGRLVFQWHTVVEFRGLSHPEAAQTQPAVSTHLEWSPPLGH